MFAVPPMHLLYPQSLLIKLKGDVVVVLASLIWCKPWHPVPSVSAHLQLTLLREGLTRPKASLWQQQASTSADLSGPLPAVWGPVGWLQWRQVQRPKLDGGETSGADGPSFVLRHRNSTLGGHTTDSRPTDPMSPREKANTPTSGSSTSHLSTAECPLQTGVSLQHTNTHGFIYLV